MDVKERSDAIIELLTKNDTVDVATLSESLKVSEMTIRRDLDRLEQQNILIRVHGGAKLMSGYMYEAPLNARLKSEYNEKKRMGEFAASLIESGDTIAIDDSSTTLAIVPFIKVPCTVVTNHLNVAAALAENDQVEVILLGGKMRKVSMSFTGAVMEETLQKFHVSKTFLSAMSLKVGEGIYDASIEEAHTKQAFMAAADETYFLFDHTKVETRSFYKVCDIENVSGIITDEYLEKEKDQDNLKKNCEEKNTAFYLVK